MVVGGMPYYCYIKCYPREKRSETSPLDMYLGAWKRVRSNMKEVFQRRCLCAKTNMNSNISKLLRLLLLSSSLFKRPPRRFEINFFSFVGCKHELPMTKTLVFTFGVELRKI